MCKKEGAGLINLKVLFQYSAILWKLPTKKKGAAEISFWRNRKYLIKVESLYH